MCAGGALLLLLLLLLLQAQQLLLLLLVCRVQVGAGGVEQQPGGGVLLRPCAQHQLVDCCSGVNCHTRLLLLHGRHEGLTLYGRVPGRSHFVGCLWQVAFDA